MQLRIATRFLCAYPVFLLLSFYVTWVAGRMQLGYWPRSSLDDPKNIGGALMAISYHITMLKLLVGVPLFCVAVIGLGIMCAVKRREDRTHRSLELLAAALLMIGFLVFAHWDPHSVIEWYFD